MAHAVLPAGTAKRDLETADRSARTGIDKACRAEHPPRNQRNTHHARGPVPAFEIGPVPLQLFYDAAPRPESACRREPFRRQREAAAEGLLAWIPPLEIQQVADLRNGT